ncbi:MAG TPA: alpha/beta fold hydrolase [Gaiellaceae bacterium]|jgi:3-oxoadipate enol-lactonase
MTVVLLGGLGTTTRIWAGVPDGLALDLPGHGSSPPPGGKVSVETIARDVLAAVPGQFTFCGLSLGGFVGMWLGVHAPERVEQLVLVCTGAKIGTREDYYARAALVRREGLEPLVAGARERWFTEDFRDDPRAEAVLDDLRGVSREGYAACAEAVGDWDFRGEVVRISVPTRVIFGRDDPVTTPEVKRQLSLFASVEIPGAHLAPVESPDEFNHHLRSAA